MESSDLTKLNSLKKALSKELKQPTRDRERLLMLESEIIKLNFKLNLITK